MRQLYDDRDVEAQDRARELDITLGSTSLLVIFFGLVLVCALCFAVGYSIGHSGSATTAGAPLTQTGEESALASGTKSKPSATAQPAVTPPPAQAVVNLPSPGDNGDASTAATEGNPAAVPAAGSATSTAPNQWTVKPALAAAPAQTSAPSAAGLKVEPATAPAVSLMVQIAAVSHAEDADVLVSALRKRNYAVTVRRDLADTLLHVQVGPFTSRADAEAMRQKLLNDGYNAIVEP